MKIKVSKYNEVGKKEMERLLEAGARICTPAGIWVRGTYLGETKEGKRIYSTDEIEVNNVKLPLADAPESYFSREIEIV